MKKVWIFFVFLMSLWFSFLGTLVQADNTPIGELKEANIINAYWVGDYKVPDLLPRKANSFLLEIQFLVNNPEGKQVQNFLKQAGNVFQLKAKGEKALTAYGYEYGYFQVNHKNIWGYWLSIDSKESVDIKYHLPYRLTIKKPNRNYRFIIKDPIIFQDLSEIPFSTVKDPGSEILTSGRPSGSKIKVTVPFDLKNGLIIINARINDSEREYRFAVDTGAGTIVIDDKVAAELGLMKKAEGRAADYFGAKNIDIVTLNRLTVGDVGVENCGAIMMSLKVLHGYNVDGVIGYDFLKFFNVQLDYEQQKLTLSRESISGDPSAFKIKLHLQPSRQITAELKVGGTGVEAKIDTGCLDCYVMIPLKFCDQNPSIFTCKPVKIIGNAAEGAIGGTEGEVTRVNWVQLGDIRETNVPVTCINSDSFVIGSAFLACFKVIFNFSTLEMDLSPIAGKQMQTNIFSYGFGSEKRDDDKIFVSGVIRGSSADLAGLKVGDEIVRIYNNENQELAYEDFISLMSSKDNQLVKLVIRSQDHQRDVTLNKAMVLPE